MTDDRPTISDIFEHARHIADPAERGRYLDEVCGADEALRSRISALLSAYEDAGEFLKITQNAAGITRESGAVPASAGAIGAARPPREERIAEGPGSIIGPYKLLELIGEGGFGTVYVAEQDRPVRRKVALKIIKLGMDTRQVIARFEAERQALAMMDHPNIARVFDGGATETGRPYFVMELVRGVPITEFCDSVALPTQERLKLFVSVCQAVQHAHQKGIIHRDLKPTNVLVSRHDDNPMVKVIDFGIAKATGGRLTEKTLFTEMRQMIGTPAYMSPEQAGQSDWDVDTRSDVYSLGVLLYELLTGTTPFEMKTLLSAGYAEIQRIIREVEPPKPSTRLSTMKDSLPSVAANRKVEPDRLARLMRGDLDWIVMKCLEKDRRRRYDTANGLAVDIQRFLSGEPVVAAPPSRSYRLRKFVHRNRGLVIAGSLVASAVLLGTIGTSFGLVWAIRERNRASQEAARATALNNFMEQMFLAADPESNGDRSVTVVEVLSKASAKADRTLHDQPESEASARTFLGNTFRALGRIDEANKELQRAVELRSQGAERNTLYHAYAIRSLALVDMAKGEYQAAVAKHREALSILKGIGPSVSRELCTQTIDLAQALTKSGEYAEAEQACAEADRLIAQQRDRQQTLRADLLGARATIELQWRGDAEKAEQLQLQEVDIRRQLGEANLLADSLNSLATVQMNRGRHDEALENYKQCLEIQRSEFGMVHQFSAITLENMANLYFSKKDYDKSLDMLNEVLDIRTKLFGAESFPVARTRFNMGVIALEKKDYPRSLELIDGALVVLRKNLGDQHIEVAHALRNKAVAMKELGDIGGALREAKKALAIYERTSPPTDGRRMRAVLTISEILVLKNDAAQARRLLNESLRRLDPGKPEQNKWIKRIQEQLAKCDATASESQPAPDEAPASKPAD